MDKLPVIFRADRSGPAKGEVTAVFPTLPAGRGEMTCYAHVGQHSGCSPSWYRTTRPAKPHEYVDLLLELRRIYSRADDPDAVELVICERITPAHRKAFWQDQRS